jgi:hypothetical protein
MPVSGQLPASGQIHHAFIVLPWAGNLSQFKYQIAPIYGHFEKTRYFILLIVSALTTAQD